MLDPDATLKQIMNAVIVKWGTSAVLADLAEHVASNAKWYADEHEEKVNTAAYLLRRAGFIALQLEIADNAH